MLFAAVDSCIVTDRCDGQLVEQEDGEGLKWGKVLGCDNERRCGNFAGGWCSFGY